jgi:hypothetical protein
MPNPLLSISLVIYRERFETIKSCLNIIRSVNLPMQIFVIDNGASELTRDEDLKSLCQKNLPDLSINYIISAKNGGYGHGHNQGIFRSNAKYHLILNNDVAFEASTLVAAVKFMEENPDIGMLVPDVYDENEKRVYLCRKNPSIFITFLRRFAPNSLKKLFKEKLAAFEMRDKDYEQIMTGLTNPTGCFMLCRLDLLKKLGGFDEHFFLYYEDADLGRRMAKLSTVAYVPQIKITHQWQRAAYHDRKMAWIAIKSALYYAWKWRLQK